MIENPCAKPAPETRVKDEDWYPFGVACIVPQIDEVFEHPAVEIIKSFCRDNKVAFSAREYDAHRYVEDCDYISRMPAFHIYDRSRNLYRGTFFTDNNPIQKIQDEIVFWRRQQERKRQRRDAWNNRMARFSQFFEGLGKKKPAPKRSNAVPIEFNTE